MHSMRERKCMCREIMRQRDHMGTMEERWKGMEDEVKNGEEDGIGEGGKNAFKDNAG